MTPLDEVQQEPRTTLESPNASRTAPFEDPRWPKVCECGHEFLPHDAYQIFVDRVYRRTDNDQLLLLRDAEPGAMWDAWWYHDFRTGLDGKSIVVVCPDGHQWFIDGRANNCTMPEDAIHRCWCRHGEPPNLTVNKDGNTCLAGGGSIQTPKYHGRLINGEFVS